MRDFEELSVGDFGTGVGFFMRERDPGGGGSVRVWFSSAVVTRTVCEGRQLGDWEIARIRAELQGKGADTTKKT